MLTGGEDLAPTAQTPDDSCRCQERSLHPPSPHPGSGALAPVSLPPKPVAAFLSFLLSSKEYLVSEVQSVSLPQELTFPPGLSDGGYLREQLVTYHFLQKRTLAVGEP